MRFRQKQDIQNDPVAVDLDWKPYLLGIGSGFQTHEVIVEGQMLKVIPTVSGRASGLAYLLPGTAAATSGLYLLSQAAWIPGPALLAGGVILSHLGVKQYLKVQGFTFNSDTGRYYRGKYYMPFLKEDRDFQGKLDDLHAIQVLSEFIPVKLPKFISYEINLVFKDGFRLNLMDHADHLELFIAAANLARFLGLPVWADEQWHINDNVERDQYSS